MNPLELLSNFAAFAMRHGKDVESLIDMFRDERPELFDPPPEAGADEIDVEIDEMIDRGDV